MEDLASKQARKIKVQFGDDVARNAVHAQGQHARSMFSGRHNIKTEEDGSIFIVTSSTSTHSQLFAGRQTSIGPPEQRHPRGTTSSRTWSRG